MHEVINQFFDFDTARPYFSSLARGFLTTLEILALAEIIRLTLGLVLAVMRRFRVDARRPVPARAGAGSSASAPFASSTSSEGCLRSSSSCSCGPRSLSCRSRS